MPMSDSKYAVIQLVGKQHLVHEGGKITVDNLNLEEGKTLKIEDVLLLVDGEKKQIGDPLVKGASVSFKVVSNQKEKKIRVATYKAKSRSRKVHGHRQHTTTLEVTKIAFK